MLVILDTDLLTILQRGSLPAVDRLRERLRHQAIDPLSTSLVSFQEQVQGWLALLHKAKKPAQVLKAYSELQALLKFYSAVKVWPFDQAAYERFADLRQSLRRMGTSDLRIAAIALANGATVLTRNLRDYRQVPGLVVEDWSS